MADKKFKWTDQQNDAITAEGSDVLVTASAGTGKTTVLSGRCVHIVSEKSDVRNILVLTFTEAAAEQMRSKIADTLRDEFLRRHDNRLRFQLILLQGSDISTIHSFCKRIITEHFYELGLDPAFRVIDSDEQKLLKAEVLEDTIDWAWQQSELCTGLSALLYRRDIRKNDGLLSKIISFSEYLDGVVSRQNWYERAALLSRSTDMFNSGPGEKQIKIITRKIQDILAQLYWSMNFALNMNAENSWAEKFRNTHMRPIEDCLETLNSRHWNKCADFILNYQKPVTNKPKTIEENFAKLFHETAKDAVDSFEKLSELAVINPDYLDKVGLTVGSQTLVLIELIRKFDELYKQAKKKVNSVDFADLEHFALRLLSDENSTQDNPYPSKTAIALQKRYKHIFVDEYQDINAVQQRILKLLSPGGNILQVGDVKQSIYAFRGAEPDIFIKQLNRASRDNKNSPEGYKVDLNLNFRSAKGILDFVNKIFSRVMTESLAGINYDENALLKPALKEEKKSVDVSDGDKIVELHILDEKDEELETNENDEEVSNGDDIISYVSARQRQAAMIAQRIRQMVGVDSGKAEFQVFDKEHKNYRDVQYRDIVVLMRSLAKKANDYVEILRLAGIPVSCQATAGYFQATEISDCLSLLKVLDNPQRDIELAAVLRSPFFMVSDTELAKIKISIKPDNNLNFYNSLLNYCETGKDKNLSEKLKNIIFRLEQWRTMARRGSLADLIWLIYRQSNYLAFVTALPNGQARRANLLKLHDRAIQFEGFAANTGIPSLTRFVEFFEKLQETGQDWAPAEPQNSAGNTVRIISIHKSKGLEFPVVFLAELESRFNRSDVQADCLISSEDTLGLQIIDAQSKRKLSTLAHEVISEQKLSTLLAEEMRILYVATTRARERLILTASQKQFSCGRIITKGLFFENNVIADWLLRDCRSPLEWVLLGLADQKILHDGFETGLSHLAKNDNLFDFTLYNAAQLRKLSEFITYRKAEKLKQGFYASNKSLSTAESKLLSQIKQSLYRQYKYGDSHLIPAKTSVSELSHRDDEYVKFDYSGTFGRKPVVLKVSADGVENIPQSRQIGTASHLVISQLDLTKPVDKQAIEHIKTKLISGNILSENISKHINIETIADFFENDLGRLALDKNNKVFREWPFTFAESVSSHEPQVTDNDFIIVQGIIDMLIQTPEGLIIIDFKTDKVTAGQAHRRAEFYRRQLELYGRAAEAVFKSKTISRWLYFLTPQISVEVK